MVSTGRPRSASAVCLAWQCHGHLREYRPCRERSLPIPLGFAVPNQDYCFHCYYQLKQLFISPASVKKPPLICSIIPFLNIGSHNLPEKIQTLAARAGSRPSPATSPPAKCSFQHSPSPWPGQSKSGSSDPIIMVTILGNSIQKCLKHF